MSECKPKVVQTVIRPPSRTVKCFNCGCNVPPGTCHCGAEVWWAYDRFDGWYAGGSITEHRIEQRS